MPRSRLRYETRFDYPQLQIAIEHQGYAIYRATMDKLASLEAFVRSVDLGGFARAARELRLSPAMIGKHVASLEVQFGARLLHRTTRRLTLTDPGKSVYDSAVVILREFAEAGRVAAAYQSEPSGHLRITAPVALAEKVGPVFADFAIAYPKTRLEVMCDDRVLDMVDGKLDLAVRVGRLPDSGLIARKLMSAPVVVCAAPSYLTARGVPSGLEDLADHDCIAYEHQWSGEGWAFSDTDGLNEVVVKLPRVSCRSNNGQIQRALVLAGKGLAQMPVFIVEDDIAAGRLVPVLTAVPPIERWVHAVYLPNSKLPTAIRVIVDFLVKRFKTM